MKKRLLALILAGTMAMMVVGCGAGDVDEVEDVNGTDSEASVEDEADTDVEVDVEADTDAEAEDKMADLGTPLEVIDALYANAVLDPELADQIENGAFQQAELDETLEGMFLGETAVEYASGAVSAPAMSSIAYQVVVLQLEDGQDVEAVKTELVDTADTAKWVCVVPETVVAESNGNYVLFIMADTATADALVEIFLAL